MNAIVQQVAKENSLQLVTQPCQPIQITTAVSVVSTDSKEPLSLIIPQTLSSPNVSPRKIIPMQPLQSSVKDERIQQPQFVQQQQQQYDDSYNVETISDFVAKYEINPKYIPSLSKLAQYSTVIICDDSGSMEDVADPGLIIFYF